MRTILQTLIGITLLVGIYATNSVFGQTPICEVKGDRIVCTIKENAPEIIGPFEVPNTSKVTIKVIEKSPFDDCSLGEIKLTDIKESDAIAAILKILAKASGFSIPDGMSDLANDKIPTDPTGDLLNELKLWRRDLTDKNNAAKGTIKAAADLAHKLDDLFAKPPRNRNDYVASFGVIKPLLETALSGGEPTTEPEEVRYPLVRERYKVLVTTGVPASDQPALAEAGRVLDDVAGLIASLKINTSALVAARVEMRTVRVYLNQVEYAVQNGNPFEKEFVLLGYTQKAAETSITCTNTFTKNVTLSKLPVTVLYKNDPALSVSVGILLSTTAKQKLGIVPQRTGVDSNGVPTFKNVFGVADHARVQIVPFSFINYRLFYFGAKSEPLAKPKYSLSLSAGVGVNPNSGSNEVEYFFGPALGIKNYLIQFGDHIGRFQKGLNGGFVLGDTVPANFPSTLPINKVYKHGFGIAISYRLPL
ncbi:MAG: hypothetical protein ACKVQJ_03665 [Pyrinomonadaceae bacterium]